jgi:hypothetical protein
VTALVAALAAMGLAFAQDVRPGLDFYHTWQYAALEGIAMLLMISYAWGARAGADGVAGKRLALALVGALVVAGSGLVAGLIGPDTVTVAGAPGSVVPVIDLRAAAFFGSADAATIARGDAPVTLRQKGAPPLAVPASGHLYLGTSIVSIVHKPAAFVSARDVHGNHLTVTQPANASFLSPVLVFPNTQPIKDKVYPLDTFATPALHRIARVLYFSAEDAATFNHLGSKQPALVISVNDDANHTVGLTIAPSGRDVLVGDLRLTFTIGSYPQLAVASAPHPAFLIGGGALFLFGVIAAFSTARRSRTESVQASPTA